MPQALMPGDYKDGLGPTKEAGGYPETEGLVEPVDARTVQIWFRNSADFFRRWRDKAEESYRFYSPDSAGHWNSRDKAYLESFDPPRPVVSFNRAKPMVDAVAGFESSNKQDVKYVPRIIGTGGPSEIYTEAARYFRDISFADDNNSDAFQDCCICGYGFTHMVMDYLEDPAGNILEKRKSPIKHYLDERSTEKNARDRHYLMYLEFMPKNRARAIFGDVVDEIQPASAHNYRYDEARHAVHYKVRTGYDPATMDLAIIKCEYWIYQEVYRVHDPNTGEIVEFDPERFKDFRNIFEANRMPFVKERRKQWRTAYVCAGTVLKEFENPTGAPTMNVITGYRDELEGVNYGLMEAMKDPTRWSNKFFSLFLDIVASNSKGGGIAETGAFEDPEQAEEKWSDPASLLLVKTGYIDKVRDRPQTAIPAAVDRLLQIAVGATRDVVGINLEFLGMANRDQAGIVEMERKRSVLVVLSSILSNYNSYRHEGGKQLLAFMQTFIHDGRLIRIRGPEGMRYAPFLKTPHIKYDVVVDLAPDAPNLKDDVWRTLEPLLVPLIQQGYQLPPSLIRYLPIPESVAQEWIQWINRPPQQNEVMAALEELKNQMADTQEKLSRAQLNVARAREHDSRTQSAPGDQQIDMFEALTKRIDAVGKLDNDRAND